MTEHVNEASRPEGQEDDNSLKAIGAVAYLGILFFIPLVTRPNNKFATFHANQGLLLLIAAVGISIVSSVIPIIGWFIIGPIGSLAIFVLFVIGVINALGNKMERLPVIGNFDLITPQKEAKAKAEDVTKQEESAEQ